MSKSKLELKVVPKQTALPQLAVQAAVGQICKAFAQLKEEAVGIAERSLRMGNLAIQLGLNLQEATGRENLELNLFERLQGLPEGLTFAFATRAVSLANRREGKKFETLAEVHPELKLLFQGINLLEAPKRGSAGPALEQNWGTWIPTTFAPLNNELVKLQKDEPMETWTEERLESFVEQTRTVHDLHDAARKRLQTTN